MRVVGYSFDREPEAKLARQLLLTRFDLPAAVRLGDLANDGVLLAFHAPERLLPEIDRLMASYGGLPTVNMDANAVAPRRR